jgi:hypothetical protein
MVRWNVLLHLFELKAAEAAFRTAKEDDNGWTADGSIQRKSFAARQVAIKWRGALAQVGADRKLRRDFRRRPAPRRTDRDAEYHHQACTTPIPTHSSNASTTSAIP